MWQAIKNFFHLFQAAGANIWYRFPSRKLTMIGVTGTDGKTTTSSLIYHVLNEAGYKAALVNTVSAVIDGKKKDVGFHVTTPRFFALQAYVRKAKNSGAKFFVLEVTSHAVDQNRIAGMHFDVGVLTNVTREHLDYHKTYEKYVSAKAKLLKKAKIAIVNKDDRSYLRIKNHEFKKRNKMFITFGLKKDSDINPHYFPFKTKLIGKFNQYNCLAAIAVLLQLHIPEEAIRKGIASFKAPDGRQEVVYDKDFKVIIDFAHTPNSFANILQEMKKMTEGRLIHVFGSAAKRDTYKRPEMGKISSEFADVIILTAEDSRNEPVEKIMEEIATKIPNSKFQITNNFQNSNIQIKNGKKYLFKIPDRKEAVRFAVSLAQKGDTVLLTGKGHEKTMNNGNGEEPWVEKQAVKEALKIRFP